MTAMTFTTDTVIIEPAPRVGRKPFLKRLMDAMIASRQRKAEIEIRRIETMLGRSLRSPAETDAEAHALLPFRGE